MKSKKFKSLKIVLSSFVVAIVILLTVVLVIISYTASYNAVEASYLNQLNNFNMDIANQMKNFYDQQKKNVVTLAHNQGIIDAAATGNYGKATPLLKDFSTIQGIYQDVFITSAELKPTILATTLANAKGVLLNNPEYMDNFKKALDGKVEISRPQKSMITGKPIILVTAPIMAGKAIKGFIGLSVNVGEFSKEIVKDVKIGKTGYPYITDDSGLAFGHPKDENILKLKIGDYDWGKQLLAATKSEVIRYNWEGKDKIQTFIKNKEYGFISMTTIYVSDINDDAKTMAMIMIICGLLGIAIVGGAIYFVISNRLKPLVACKAVMEEMAQGNLSKRYEGKITGDEIGDIVQSMNNSLEQFERLVSEIIIAVQNLSQAVQEIASGNENLSQRTAEQASSLEEVASTIEEATASIKQSADNSLNAKKMATDSFRMAEDGGKVVGDAVGAINDVNVFSRKIGEIISVINEIAFQTNLLALNAAVEAARAGEQGRGFAVVAGEVRNLAQRAAGSAKEIGKLIQDSLEKVGTSTELANKSGEALKEIIHSVKAVDQLISEISAASEEQKRGIDQINIAIAELDTMTQQNAALVEETASASEEMSNQSQELIGMMEKFKIRDNVRNEVYSLKRKELHLHTGGNEVIRNDGNGRKRIAQAPAQQAKSKDIKDILTNEGFEEF
jgi:methyl-accepting chemotaxis protein